MKHLKTLLVICSISILACAQQKESEVKAEATTSYDYVSEVVVGDLSIPWGFVFLPDGAMLITEKSGELIHFKEGTKTLISGLPEIYVRGQGGLLDIELHPNYADNGWIYLTHASADGPGDGGNTALIRAKLEGNTLTNVEQLYKGELNTTKGQHFGSRIEFDNDGYLYFSIGDRGNRDENPQDITRDGGKIYRLNDDGSIPDDNPFVDEANAKTAIYSYGHRNPQGMMMHPETGEIWVHEHGPKGGDEINIIAKGKNYGWPLVSYGVNYSGTSFTDNTTLPGMKDPLFYWVPSIAPSGMTFVTSDIYPEWNGNLLVGSLKFNYLEGLVLENNTVVKRKKLLEDIGRVRSVKQGPDGYIYVGVENLGIVKMIKK
ncbi:glucose/arabinose dehydrogenase [Winogradskyella epiphytica]|uniref:Glucose/arabinose dehydrogenase n=1 Tax=Winogradskyella epiphytica TaxID=262005 RepID=A0A2V4Y0Z4_9FLAO|nr:PQQ-dependent sugar dehydrogenase [Winogradskyella epiphytica]PYE82078.1 glucose/arabinose dehydrogenase [Winogradskyella epiphytica]GGW60673.1 pyrroloquinoline-quinone glucose dehydrogenase [Winogradskyella epiphytica]